MSRRHELPDGNLAARIFSVGVSRELWPPIRGGTVIGCSRANERDLEEVPKEVREDLDIRLIRKMDQVLSHVLEAPLEVPTIDEDQDAL